MNSNIKKPLIIGVSGPSASGKSLLVENILASLPQTTNVAVLSEDSYYRDRSDLSLEERNNLNYDHPNAFEHDLMEHQIKELQNNNEIEVPCYDFTTHLRTKATRTVQPGQVIIIDGILILAVTEIRKLLDIAIFMDTPLDICLIRRLKRDQEERQRDISLILEQYQNSVRPMYWQFVSPSKEFANLIVPGGGKNKTAIELIKNNIEQSFDNITE
ncbi:MAG: uridine kinase [Legionellales bacterium]|jgi:uridine kinase|nr:uridine kinase [Legionellales bacterium]